MLFASRNKLFIVSICTLLGLILYYFTSPELDLRLLSRIGKTTDQYSLVLSDGARHNLLSQDQMDRIEREKIARAIPNLHYAAPEICANMKPFVAFFTAKPDEEMRRDEIRDYSRPFTSVITVLFSLGISRNKTVAERNIQEAIVKKDVIIGEYYDAYFNLSRKVFFSLQFIEDTCRKPYSIVAKVDTDVMANWGPFVSQMQNYLDKERKSKEVTLKTNPNAWTLNHECIWMGNVRDGTNVISNPKSKNYEIIAREFYPPHVHGPFYILNRPMVQLLLKRRRKHLRYYNNEDTLLGILAEGLVQPRSAGSKIIYGNKIHARAAVCRSQVHLSLADCSCREWWAYSEPPTWEHKMMRDTIANCKVD